MSQLSTLLQQGGYVVWVLLVASVIALAIVIVKQWQFLRIRPESLGSIDDALWYWHRGERDAAIAVLQKAHTFGSELVSFVMQQCMNGHVTETLREEVNRRGAKMLRDLRAYLPALELIGTLSPLLGLLGTVLGMIEAFQAMELAGNEVDPSTLSGGIWQALLTTALGLVVAIPVLVIYNWMNRKVQRVAEKMEDVVTQVFTSAK